jgi:PAS domain S-box-containing protein
MDHLRIEKELAETKNFYEEIVQNLQSGVIVTDSDDTIFFANQTIFVITGIPSEKLRGGNITGWKGLFPKADISEFVEKYIIAKKLLKPYFYENIKVYTPHGRKTYLSGWMIPNVMAGHYNGMTCTIRDTTQSQELTMLLRITLDNSPYAIGISKVATEHGEHGTTYFTNKKMRQLFDQEDVDYMELTIQESLKRCEKFIRNKNAWRKFLKQHATNGTKNSLIIKHTNGKEYNWTSENLLDNDGKLWGRMAIVKEVSQGRRKEDR